MKVHTYEYLEKNGRLGNQLWQVAGTLSKAWNENSVALIKPNWEYREYFSVPDKYFGIPSNSDEIVDGETDYMQRFHMWESEKEMIWKYFQPSDLAEEYLEANYQWFYELLEDVPICAIHVRRGDYLNNPHLFPSPTVKYHTTALELVYNEGISDFVVFSDDIEWCKQYFSKFPYKFHYVAGVSRPVEIRQRRGKPQDHYDLFLMAQCDKHIIANSTFSWWGAFLSNNSTPIYPNVWFGPEIPEYPVWRQAIPDGWQEIEC